MDAIISGVASFIIFHLASHPNSRIQKKLPRAKIKRVQLFPNLNFEAKNRVFHIHHWMVFTPLLILVQTWGRGILQSDLLNGFMIGGIVQGLLYKDSLKFVHHNKDYQKKIRNTSYHRLKSLRKFL